jgi:hypothetical protein
VLPFGFGKRACPGKRLAEVKLYITVAKMFHAFEITLDDEIQTEFNFLLVPAGPMRMSLFKRMPARVTTLNHAFVLLNNPRNSNLQRNLYRLKFTDPDILLFQSPGN